MSYSFNNNNNNKNSQYENIFFFPVEEEKRCKRCGTVKIRCEWSLRWQWKKERDRGGGGSEGYFPIGLIKGY